MALHFTKQQIDEIEQALIARSKKDSSFPGVDILDGTELIPVIQGGVNKVTTYSGLWNAVSKDLRQYVEDALDSKVDVEEGKQLSTEDYTTEDKSKLSHIEAGAQVNVNSDWNATTGDAYIVNKPDLSVYATKASLQDITALIPTQASQTNQLADKAFVNSTVATETAEFKGTYNTLSELETVAANKNDYGFVISVDSVGNTQYDKYKYTGTTWLYEYSLNNSSFTASQWAAIQSGITDALVEKLSALPTNESLQNTLLAKVDKVNGKGLSTNDYTTAEKTKLAGIEEGSQVNVIEGVQVNGSDLPVSNKKVNIDLSGIEGWSPVIAAAFAKLQSEIDSLKELLNDYQLKVKAESVDVLEYKIAGMPRILYSSTAGAPSASNVPDNWDESTMNGWSGVPRFIGQLYLDKSGKKVYFAAAVTNSTGDWVVLN